MEKAAWNLEPADIEARSMAIIDDEAGSHSWPPRQWPVVRRMIHTTADFDWAGIAVFSPGAVEAGVAALKAGKTIYTDTGMARAGMSQHRLGPLGVTVRCLMAEARVADMAAQNHTTRAVAAMDLAVREDPGAIFVIGNAPTALLRLVRHAEAGRADPALVVGLPVGFVNAAEAKQTLADTNLTHITARGRKGGSNVAAAVINALAIMALEKQL